MDARTGRMTGRGRTYSPTNVDENGKGMDRIRGGAYWSPPPTTIGDGPRTPEGGQGTKTETEEADGP